MQHLFHFNDLGRFRRVELHPSLQDLIFKVQNFDEIAAFYGIKTTSECWEILLNEGPPRKAVSDDLLDRIRTWKLPRDYIEVVQPPDDEVEEEAPGPLAATAEDESGSVWGKALKAAASAAKASSEASSSRSGQKAVSPLSVGGSQKKSSSNSQSLGRASKGSEEIVYPGSGAEAKDRPSGAEAKHCPSNISRSRSPTPTPSRGIGSGSEFSVSDPSLSQAKMLHEQMTALMARQEQMEQREQALKRKQAEMEDAHHKALEKIREEMDISVREALEKSAVDTAKELSRRRHTGVTNSAWADKKKARAEAHHRAKASGDASSSGAAASSSSSGPGAVLKAGFCVSCGKNHAGGHCFRTMCRPCCLKTYLVQKRTDEKNVLACKQHQQQ